jgi:hypothetical protein
MLARRDEFKKERDDLRAEVARDPQLAASIDHEIAYADYLFRLIDQSLPDEATRRQPGFDIRDWRQRKFDRTLKRPKVM